MALLLWAVVPASAQLTSLGNRLIDECTSGLEECEPFDLFGQALAAGDFDGDGFDDLAVGVPRESVGGFLAAGAVHIFYGSNGGLESNGDQVFTQSSSGISDTPEEEDFWGDPLVSGDFNGDGFADLAIGGPDEDVGAIVDAGAVWVLFGSAAGLTGTGSRAASQSTLPCCTTETSESSDFFGTTLAVVPASGGASADALLIGTPSEAGPVFDAEGVVIKWAQSGGVPLNGATDYRQNDSSDPCGETNEGNDQFGAGLAVGKFFGTAPTLAFGAPGEDLGFSDAAGRLIVENGTLDECWDQGTSGVLEVIENGDRFSAALASGDFDGDGFDDLAIGAPGETAGAAAAEGAGGVNVLYGSGSGLTSVDDQFFDQDDFPSSTAEGSDEFGGVFAVGDFDGDAIDDLAVGTPFEDLFFFNATRTNAGEVNIAYGVAVSGLSTAAGQTFHQNLPADMLQDPASVDAFGSALASGDFDGNGVDDLAIGVPGDNPGGQGAAGLVQVLYGLDRSTGVFGTVQFEASEVVVSEGDATEVLFVLRTGSSVVTASVDHARTGGTATVGADVSYTAGTESWGVDDLVPESIGVFIQQDAIDEPDETLVLTLSNPSAGTAIGSPATLTLTIVDDDGLPMIFADGFEGGNGCAWSAPAPACP